MQAKEIIAQPFTLPNGVVIKNRILKSAMSEALGNRDGEPKPESPPFPGRRRHI